MFSVGIIKSFFFFFLGSVWVCLLSVSPWHWNKTTRLLLVLFHSQMRLPATGRRGGTGCFSEWAGAWGHPKLTWQLSYNQSAPHMNTLGLGNQINQGHFGSTFFCTLFWIFCFVCGFFSLLGKFGFMFKISVKGKLPHGKGSYLFSLFQYLAPKVSWHLVEKKESTWFFISKGNFNPTGRANCSSACSKKLNWAAGKIAAWRVYKRYSFNQESPDFSARSAI